MKKLRPIEIAVVDDEAVICDLLVSYIESWKTTHDRDVHVSVFHSAEAFSFEWETTQGFDIILLDIQMNGASGIMLAKQIRELDTWLRIIFITGISDYVYEGYNVNAMNYLLKPIAKVKVLEALNRACASISLDESSKEAGHYVFESDGVTRRLLLSEIIFCEAQKNYVRLSSTQGTFYIKTTFADIEAALGKVEFVKTHRSYLVGLGYIYAISKNELTLDTQIKVPVSRHQRDAVQGAFIAFHKGKERTHQ